MMNSIKSCCKYQIYTYFFEKEEISSDDIEALLYKTGIVTESENITKAAIERSEHLPIVLENIEEVEVDNRHLNLLI